MKPLMLISLCILAAVGVTFIACAKKPAAAPAAKPEKVILPNSPIAAGDTVESFRFERYDVGKDGRAASEVFFVSVNKDRDFTYFYHRKLGDYQATSYDDVKSVMGDLLGRLAAAAAGLNLGGYPTTALDKESRDRSRWCVEAAFAGGKTLNIVNYYDLPLAGNDLDVATRLEGIFNALVDSIDATGFDKPSDYSVYTYDGNGKLSRRIDYLNDGTVSGGYDPDDPTSSF